eukprot:CAMPEP_0117419060 /NCGR_PEP_ID=MMETSP0758-20121206/713_1 /TAXON_ID=63605 /ORGANISM="Percolomonas cosmopolitus, Strain AE-1 (ATCC 50343)" /LENGTH=622 /DNA_ID=CAMNT_0005199929 /DNA_START=815 /DNA_END=2679 /DNA_ORIENTATION=+
MTNSFGNPIHVLCKQNNIDIQYIRDHVGPLFFENGEIVPDDLDAEAEKIFNKLLNKASENKVEGNEYVSLGKNLFEEYEDYLAKIGDLKKKEELKQLLYWHAANLEYGIGSDLEPVSMMHWDQDDKYETGGPHFYVRRGVASVINVLYDSIKNYSNNLNIKFNSVVNYIKYSNDGVKVRVVKSKSTFQNPKNSGITASQYAQVDQHHPKPDDDSLEMTCDATIVTVPLGCYKNKDIKFDPPLKPDKQRAIQNLGFGLLNKVILLFNERFWTRESHMDYFGIVNKNLIHRGKSYMTWDLSESLGKPCLMVLFTGKYAVALESKNHQQVIAETMATIRLIFGKNSPDPINAFVTNWRNDPYSTGSYSFIGTGGSGKDYDIMSRSEAFRLFFAGEATCRQYPATVFGAAMSGYREAGAIDDVVEIVQNYVTKNVASEDGSYQPMDDDMIIPDSPTKKYTKKKTVQKKKKATKRKREKQDKSLKQKAPKKKKKTIKKEVTPTPEPISNPPTFQHQNVVKSPYSSYRQPVHDPFRTQHLQPLPQFHMMPTPEMDQEHLPAINLGAPQHPVHPQPFDSQKVDATNEYKSQKSMDKTVKLLVSAPETNHPYRFDFSVPLQPQNRKEYPS